MPGAKIVVDTNIFIDIMNGYASLAEKVNTYKDVYISPIVWLSFISELITQEIQTNK